MNDQSPCRFLPFGPLAVLFLAAVISVSCARSHPAGTTPLPIGYVDVPKAGQAIDANTLLAGWALCEGGIAEVSVYVDGKYGQSAELGNIREDVGKAYPNFAGAEKGGWSLRLATERLTAGPHQLLFRVRSAKGDTKDLAVVPVTIRK